MLQRRAYGKILRNIRRDNLSQYSTIRRKQDILATIGRNSEILTEATKCFFRFPDPYDPLLFPNGHSHHPIFDGDVELSVRNSPSESLLNLHGLQTYRKAYKFVRIVLGYWWLLRYKKLHVQAHPLVEAVQTIESMTECSGPIIFKLRWKVEGIKRLSRHPTSILSGNSYYRFDRHTGLVTQHLIDRLVPPGRPNAWLWWSLERLQIAPISPKPLINIDGNDQR